MKTELQKQINKTLNQNPKTKDLKIEAIDNNGIITLKGTADSTEKSKEIEELVEGQEGVSAVVNEIRVVSEEESGEDEEVMVIPQAKPHQPSVILKKEEPEEE